MWIRSQSKSVLANINCFDICADYDSDYYLIYGGDYELGIYSTEEKKL